MTEQELAETIRAKLGGLFDIQKITLFGSRARAVETASVSESDWDVLVITQTDIPFIKRQGLAMRQIGVRDYSLDLLVYTPDEASQAAQLLGSALYWAEREGRTLYAK